jgi:hypothetical protein
MIVNVSTEAQGERGNYAEERMLSFALNSS